MAPAPTEESVTNTPSRSPAKVVSVAVHRGSGSACRVAVSRRSRRCDRTQTMVMTRAMPKAVVIRGGEAAGLGYRSQQHEGWVWARPRYDDGGFSGGNLDRPALQQPISMLTSPLAQV